VVSCDPERGTVDEANVLEGARVFGRPLVHDLEDGVAGARLDDGVQAAAGVDVVLDGQLQSHLTGGQRRRRHQARPTGRQRKARIGLPNQRLHLELMDFTDVE